MSQRKRVQHHVLSQYEKVKEKVLKQANLILKKLKPPESSKEVSNQDIAISLSSYSIQGHLTESQEEILHERLTRLDQRQMEIINLYYFQGKTQEEISVVFGKTHQWVSLEIGKALEIMR